MEIPSPFTGTVEEIKVKPDDTVKVGEVLMVFGEGNGQAAGEARPAGEATAKAAPVEKTSPRVGLRPGADPSAAGLETGASRGAGQAVAPKRDGPVPASPSTRRLARELGVDLCEVRSSGPAGLVTAQDVRAFAERVVQPAETASPEPVAVEPEAPVVQAQRDRAGAESRALPDFGRCGAVEKVPLRSVRRATARHMAMAWSQIPHVNHQDVADITRLDAYRREHKAEIEDAGGQLTTTVFVMKAVVAALKVFPRFNSSLDATAEEIILKRYYHLGIAVDTEQGLMVPVVRDVDRKSITELSAELKQTAERARAGDTALEEMQGGTFTITNIGALGGTGFAPIINYPEVAILGWERDGGAERSALRSLLGTRDGEPW